MRILVLLVLSLVLGSAPALAAPPIPTGSWDFSHSDRELSRAEASVEEVVSEVNLLFRGVARSKLAEHCKPWSHLEIGVHDGSVVVVNDYGTVESPLDRAIQRNSSHGLVTIRREIRDGVLVETIATDSASRTNIYSPQANGIRVESTIRAPRLPRPVRFVYTYR